MYNTVVRSCLRRSRPRVVWCRPRLLPFPPLASSSSFPPPSLPKQTSNGCLGLYSPPKVALQRSNPRRHTRQRLPARPRWLVDGDLDIRAR